MPAIDPDKAEGAQRIDIEPEDNLIADVADALPQDTKVHPMVAVGAIALNMAMKYLDIATVQDGTLYQQYKLEGKNMQGISLELAFHYAKQIEKHLITTDARVAKIVIDAISEAGIDIEDVPEDADDIADAVAEHESPTPDASS